MSMGQYKNDWTYTELVCMLAYIWAEVEQEKGKEALQDFDFYDMADACREFANWVEQHSHCMPDDLAPVYFEGLTEECANISTALRHLDQYWSTLAE